jgi:hypothetical protein
MKSIKSINSRAARGIVFAAPLMLFIGTLPSFGLLAGCSMVDTPSATPSPELDVRNYYMQLATPKVVYNYAVSSLYSQYVPPSGTLTMNMKGIDDTMPNGAFVYGCLWTYQNFGTPAEWFYSLSDSQAINVGVEDSQGNYTDNWVDLQAPLANNSSWTFVSHGEKITAMIAQYGVAAQVEGQTYNDVVMVNYTGGPDSTTGTEWFQRGKGIIYSHIYRPYFGTVDNHLVSIVQP